MDITTFNIYFHFSIYLNVFIAKYGKIQREINSKTQVAEYPGVVVKLNPKTKHFIAQHATKLLCLGFNYL